MHYPTACSIVQCPSRFVDFTSAVPRVPARNFTARLIARQPVPVDTVTNRVAFVIVEKHYYLSVLLDYYKSYPIPYAWSEYEAHMTLSDCRFLTSKVEIILVLYEP